MSCTHSILLRPRPYAQHAGSFFLVALLPPPKIVPSLPSELWSAIFEFVAIQPGLRQLWSLLTVCRRFKVSAQPASLPKCTNSNARRKLCCRCCTQASQLQTFIPSRNSWHDYTLRTSDGIRFVESHSRRLADGCRYSIYLALNILDARKHSS